MVNSYVTADLFKEGYLHVTEGDSSWQNIDVGPLIGNHMTYYGIGRMQPCFISYSAKQIFYYILLLRIVLYHTNAFLKDASFGSLSGREICDIPLVRQHIHSQPPVLQDNAEDTRTDQTVQCRSFAELGEMNRLTCFRPYLWPYVLLLSRSYLAFWCLETPSLLTTYLLPAPYVGVGVWSKSLITWYRYSDKVIVKPRWPFSLPLSCSALLRGPRHW